MLLKQEIDEEDLIKDIMKQQPMEEDDINFKNVLRERSFTEQEKRHTWCMLKKRVAVRDKLDLETTL